MIEARSACKAFGDTIVVDRVSLTIPAGGVTAIIGPNGAGKSSLLSLLSRLAPLSAGSVTVDGMDVSRVPGDVLAKRLSILRQDNSVGLRLSVRDLVAFGRYPHSKGRLTVEDQPHIEAALAYLNLEPLADRYLDELSGGQRQRAFVAMVLCQDTDYVLLDEPLNNLDMPHAVAMMQRLRRMADELGKTLVVVVHDLNFASCYADRIIAMKDGRVLHQGSPEQIMQTPVLHDIYGIDVPVHAIGGQRIAVYYR